MVDKNSINTLNSLSLYSSAMKKLTCNPMSLSGDELVYLLSTAILLIKKFNEDNRLTSYIELAYYIILKYSLSSKNYEPLYDFTVNFGFFPVAQKITENEFLEFGNIPFSLIQSQISEEFSFNEITETLEQRITRNRVMQSRSEDISYVAPTSFGKSSVIVEHLRENTETIKRAGIIVPTKSLLMQTYRLIRQAKFSEKILLHDEMFDGEERFIGVFTQERALRLLEKNPISFDILYVDEAHRLFEKDPRSILLTRLIKLNRIRDPKSRAIYLSPLVNDSSNLRFNPDQNIFEQKIHFNVKEPEYFEYKLDGSIWKYNRFTNDFYYLGSSNDLFEYIVGHKTSKTFCYLYRPVKIELFAKKLSEKVDKIAATRSLEEIVQNLKKYVHEDFFAIEYLLKGIVYLHGKLPDNVKEYLEYKFKTISELKILIANTVILEGIDLPIDSLFILNTTNLGNKELTNLIGRVNRLGQIFKSGENNLKKLLPSVHFVNSTEYNRLNGNMEAKIRLLKSSGFSDKIQNPLLAEFDSSKINEGKKHLLEYEKIRETETEFFSDDPDSIKVLKRKMIGLGIDSIYQISDDLCREIYSRFSEVLNKSKLYHLHFLDKLQLVFVAGLEMHIIDKEFERLKNNQAILYYKMFFDNRKKSLKENIGREVKYLQSKAFSSDSRLYIGESYGEIPYEGFGKNVYVDLRNKTKRDLVNIAIVKQKIEEDFVGFKLNKFFQLMRDYELISQDEYNVIIFGTNDKKKLQILKIGLPINIINRLEQDGQLANIQLDEQGNLQTLPSFDDYRNSVDDFIRFQLEKFL
jgi:hypothetical protein